MPEAPPPLSPYMPVVEEKKSYNHEILHTNSWVENTSKNLHTANSLEKNTKKHATKCDNMQTVVFKNSPTHTYFSYCCGAYWEDSVQDGISIDLYLKLGTLELHD